MHKTLCLYSVWACLLANMYILVQKCTLGENSELSGDTELCNPGVLISFLTEKYSFYNVGKAHN